MLRISEIAKSLYSLPVRLVKRSDLRRPTGFSPLIPNPRIRCNEVFGGRKRP
jgi:hypothetical protein